MPEGPEVRYTSYVLKKRIFENEHRHEDEIKERLSEVTGIENLLEGKTPGIEFFKGPIVIKNIRSYGKKIIFSLSNGIIGISLGLTGRLSYSPDYNNITRSRMSICIKTKEKENKISKENFDIYLVDATNFGNITYINTKQSWDEYISRIGPDLFSTDLSLEHYVSRMKSKFGKRQICQLLLDQSIFSGVGNYLKSEILYHAKISPDKISSLITEEELKRLYESTLLLINKSYKYKGNTIKDFWHPNGELGEYPCMVYGKKFDIIGNEILLEKFKDGRSTYWVKDLQDPNNFVTVL